MAELSPVAQAVLLAAKHEPKAEYIGTLELRIAAAFRAVVGETNVPLAISDIPEQHQRWYRLGVANFERKLLTIATELENANG